VKTVNIHEAKAQLSHLLERLLTVCPGAAARELGMDEGWIEIPNDFDAPLPADVFADSQ